MNVAFTAGLALMVYSADECGEAVRVVRFDLRNVNLPTAENECYWIQFRGDLIRPRAFGDSKIARNRRKRGLGPFGVIEHEGLVPLGQTAMARRVGITALGNIFRFENPWKEVA
ncbi:unnamed protein product [Cylicostephanus goldi]|uniref:Uncharacterized protein n=1 Tax=Cylicostephanus goldi TaxID=71465 RepID=A0A3P7QLT0_CYLGO|nr:unnamed protein product [Cylicostephanus goldi]